MNHNEQVILYAADQMKNTERAEFEIHLAACAECQADLELWSAVSHEIRATNLVVSAPPHLDASALKVIDRPSKLMRALNRTFQLLWAQSFLIHREMFPASAAVMALGVIVALLSNQLEVIYFIAPMIAAASLSVLFGAEQDPAYELILATSTSPWKVLLARLSLVSAHNLILVLAVAAVLHSLIPPHLLGIMLFGWLAPMAFLSALALLLSLSLGTSNAIAITYILWVAQYMPYKSIGAWMVSPEWSSVIYAYQHFWHSPIILLLLSIPLLGITLWSTNRPAFRLAA
jgi:hypothetical protein